MKLFKFDFRNFDLNGHCTINPSICYFAKCLSWQWLIFHKTSSFILYRISNNILCWTFTYCNFFIPYYWIKPAKRYEDCLESKTPYFFSLLTCISILQKLHKMKTDGLTAYLHFHKISLHFSSLVPMMLNVCVCVCIFCLPHDKWCKWM